MLILFFLYYCIHLCFYSLAFFYFILFYVILTRVNENTSLQSMLDDISSGKAIQDEILRNKIIGALDTIARKNTSTTTTTTTTTQPSEISNDNPQTDSQGSSTLPIESVDDKESSSTTSSKDSCKNNSNTFSHLLSILFKAEGLPANDPKYYHFTNLGQSLKEALSGLTFIEYPTFHLVLSPVVSNGMLVESKEELNRLVTAPNSSLLELELRSGRFPSRLRKKKFVSTVVSDE